MHYNSYATFIFKIFILPCFFHLPLCIKLILHTGSTVSQRTLQLTTFFGVPNVLNHHSILLCSCGHVFNHHSIDKKTCFSLHLLPPCTWTLYNITTVYTNYPNTNLKVNKKQFIINIGDKLVDSPYVGCTK